MQIRLAWLMSPISSEKNTRVGTPSRSHSASNRQISGWYWSVSIVVFLLLRIEKMFCLRLKNEKGRRISGGLRDLISMAFSQVPPEASGA